MRIDVNETNLFIIFFEKAANPDRATRPPELDMQDAWMGR